MKERQANPLVELADGAYMQAKSRAKLTGMTHRVTIPMFERHFKLKASQLRNYRANHYSRK